MRVFLEEGWGGGGRAAARWIKGGTFLERGSGFYFTTFYLIHQLRAD